MEWIVVVVMVLATFGVAALGITNIVSSKGGDAKNWIGTLEVTP